MFRYWFSLICLLLVGCDAPLVRFPENRLYALTLARSQSTETEVAARDIEDLLADWFGTPDTPRWPVELLGDSPLVDFVSIERLQQAAGGVKSSQTGDHQGLYREHCVMCHGLDGSGSGPAAWYQNPYPRDFRAGVFKWKSTRRATPPTREDLRNTIEHGLPGTGMPTFARLAPEEIDSLVDYVVFLSVRGQIHRKLLFAAVTDFEYGDTLPGDPKLRFYASNSSEAMVFAQSTLQDIYRAWASAKESVVEVPEVVLNSVASPEAVERGRAWFHGPVVNCVGCHGANGAGGAVTLDFDDWTKEFTTRIGLTPTDLSQFRSFRRVGALPPRVSAPRNLQTHAFRGGDSVAQLYRRIREGVAGTPMPAAIIANNSETVGIQDQDVADLIHYVRSIRHKRSADITLDVNESLAQ